MKTSKFMHTRRKLLISTAAASLAYSLLPRIASATEARVIKKTIPSSGERLSVIGLGTSRTFDVSDSADSISPLVELMQARQGRFPELFDVISDGAGALVGLLLVVAITEPH